MQPNTIPSASNAPIHGQSALLEGKVLVHRFFHSFCDTFFFNEDFYTVQKGVVYIIEGQDGDKLTPSGDSLETLATDCTPYGDFDPTKKYPPIRRSFDYGFIQEHILPLRHHQ